MRSLLVTRIMLLTFGIVLCGQTIVGHAANPARGDGSLVIGGSGSALGAMRMLGIAFEKANPGIAVVVLPSLGTSGGIKAVAKGAIDIGLCGRPLTDEEKALGLAVAAYADTPLVLAVKTDDPLSNIGQTEFIKMLTGGVEIAPNDRRARPILRPAHDPETIVIREAFPDIGAAIDRALAAHAMVTVALTAQEAADLIERIPGAIGPSTLGLMRSENRRMKALSLDGVVPTRANIANGSYPLVINLSLASRPNPPERVRKFIEFVGSENGRRLLEESGHYVKQKGK